MPVIGRGALIWAAMWALTGAAFGVRVFESWWMHAPPPSAAVAAVEVVPADFYDSVLGTLFLVLAMGTVLMALWLGAVVSGIICLHGARAATALRRAWAYTVTAAAMISIGFLGVFLYPEPPLFGDVVIGHANWAMLGFSAGFLAIGCAMVAIIRAIRSRAPATTSGS